MEINIKLQLVHFDQGECCPLHLERANGEHNKWQQKGSQSSLPLVAKVISRLQPLEQTIRLLLQSE